MKGKTTSLKAQSKPGKDLPKNVDVKTSAKNFFLNVIIFILGIIVIFLLLSLVSKIQTLFEGNEKDVSSVPALIQLEVLNGCGVLNVADKLTDYLRDENFDVIQTGNYYTFDLDETIVIDRSGNMADAYKVAEIIGVKKVNVIQQLNEDYFLDVSLIVGKDYKKLSPFNN